MALTKPALGQDLQLGMLYDIRSEQFLAGLPLWNNDVVNSKQQIEYKEVKDPDVSYTTSLHDARIDNEAKPDPSGWAVACWSTVLDAGNVCCVSGRDGPNLTGSMVRIAVVSDH